MKINKEKKGNEITLQTVVIFIILIIVLILILYFFTSHYNTNANVLENLSSTSIKNPNNFLK